MQNWKQSVSTTEYISLYIKLFMYCLCILKYLSYVFYYSIHSFNPFFCLFTQWFQLILFVYHMSGIFPLLETSHGFTHAAPLHPESSLFPLSLNLAGLWLALTNRTWHKWHPSGHRPGASETWQLQLLLSRGPWATVENKCRLSVGENETAEAPDMANPESWILKPQLSRPSQCHMEQRPAIPT